MVGDGVGAPWRESISLGFEASVVRQNLHGTKNQNRRARRAMLRRDDRPLLD